MGEIVVEDIKEDIKGDMKIEDVDLDLYYKEALDEAALGKKVWIMLAEKYGLGPKGAALLLPYQTPVYHKASVEFLPEYMKKTGIDTAVILTEKGKDVPEWISRTLNSGIKLHFLTRQEMDALIRFYSFYEFTDRLIIGSLEMPSGRLGANMIGKKGLTLKEAVGVMLFDLS